MKPKVVVIGSSNTDMVVQSASLPMPGETVLGSDLVIAHGGKGANQAVAAARMGADVSFIARIGKDSFGDAALKQYENDGIHTRFVKRDRERPTGVALIMVDNKGENCISVALGANNALSESDINEAEKVIQEAECLLLQLEIPLNSVQRIVSC